MTATTLKEAKAHLGELVRRAQRGETVIIRQRGKPAIRLVAVDAKKLTRETDLELSSEDIGKLSEWADQERAGGCTRVFESPAAYIAHRRARRAGKGQSR